MLAEGSPVCYNVRQYDEPMTEVFQGGESAMARRLTDRLSISPELLAAFCQLHHIHRLSFFGSVLRKDFRADSDVDVLVEFEPGHVPGLFGIARMERELSALLGGRTVDLRTPEDLSRYFCDSVMREAEVQYAQGG